MELAWQSRVIVAVGEVALVSNGTAGRFRPSVQSQVYLGSWKGKGPNDASDARDAERGSAWAKFGLLDRMLPRPLTGLGLTTCS